MLRLAADENLDNDILLTWNYSRLASASKFEHVRHVDTLLGLFVPVLTTPFELLNWTE
jgi:hypothetical protein